MVQFDGKNYATWHRSLEIYVTSQDKATHLTNLVLIKPDTTIKAKVKTDHAIWVKNDSS